MEDPRTLIRASAGSGKTFQLSNRYLGLIGEGVAPDSILATTFTRKAAGEILERVLKRVAEASLDAEAAQELGASIGTPLNPERAQEILLVLVAALHRLQVGTLDSFFIRMAGVFALELGLPPGWSIADEGQLQEFMGRALAKVVAEADPKALTELLRGLNQGAADRSVHYRLLGPHGFLRELVALSRELDPGARSPWHWDGGRAPLGPEEEPRLRAEALRLLEGMPLALTAAGAPNGHWVKARDGAVAALREGLWGEVVGKGLVAAWLNGGDTFQRQPIAPDVAAVLKAVADAAARVLGAEYAIRLHALGRLVDLFQGALRQVQEEERGFGFSDVTHVLAQGPAGHAGDEESEARQLALYYRLDARVQHLLLDEFQDTSLPQWWALAPLAEEMLAGGTDGRSALVVADPKQSIYGWRGGEPRLLDGLEKRFQLPTRELVKSWRSSPVVLDAVNRIFQGLDSTSTLEKAESELQSIASQWLRGFRPHEAAHTDRPGYAELKVGPRGEESGMVRGTFLAWTAQGIQKLQARHPNATVGVLTRTNATGRRLIHELRMLGVEASDEGGSSVGDSPAVAVFLAALHLADHPGDGVARYMVASSPLGSAVGLTQLPHPGADPAGRGVREARRFSQQTREDLLERGYGPVLSEWMGKLPAAPSPREARRLKQLVELAFRFQGQSTLRTRDFLRFVETARVDDPTQAPVRIMTVHRSKGLEFDVVVLPELGGSLIRDRAKAAYPWRGQGSSSASSHGSNLPGVEGVLGRIQAFRPGVPKGLAPLFPDVEEARQVARQDSFRDSLSLLYVAVTRARHALHLWVESPGTDNDGTPREVPRQSHARILVETLGRVPAERDWGEAQEGAELFVSGDPLWWEKVAEDGSGAPVAPFPRVDPPVRRTLSPPRVVTPQPGQPRRRLLPRTSPSRLEGGSQVDLSWVLPLRSGRARARGLLIHAWCQEVEWLDASLPNGGRPDPDHLRAVAARVVPQWGSQEVDDLLGHFLDRLDLPEVRTSLSRARYGSKVRLEREYPFLHLDEGVVVEGVVDRLVLTLGSGVPIRAEILDFKSDALGAHPGEVENRIRHYTPQVTAYRRAVASRFRIPLDGVTGALLFLEPGILAPVK
ncbi:MAG: UvrD-helicase domain-containing protein [Gemmatimonadota bacterium]